MTVTRTRDGVPGWSGDPSTWLEFKQAARLYVASTKVENRYTCGPKIAAELTGAAKTAITGKKSTWLSDASGAETLLQYLQSTIGEPALPEVGNFMRQYFKVLKRKRGEAMTAFCVRHREEYERMCRSLARMVREHKQGHGKKAASVGTKTNSEPAPSQPPPSQTGADDNLEGDDPSTSAAGNSDGNTWQANPWWSSSYYGWQSGWGWHQPWGSWSYDKWYDEGSKTALSTVSECEDDDKVEILPDAVLGWFLLEKSGLDTLEKSVIQGEIKGDFTLAGVEHALRSHWSDDQIRKRDGDAKHVAAFQDEDEDPPSDEDEALTEEMTPEEMSWYQEAKADEYKAYAQFQQAKRTLKEARARQHEVKLARKYYKVSSTSSSLGGKTFSGSRPVKGPCFKCGAMGHQAKECPKREERAQLVSEAEELAEYTTYFTVDDESVHGQEGTIKDTMNGNCDELAMTAQSMPPTTLEAIHQGKAIIDGGATKTMASVYALEKLSQANMDKRGESGVAKVDGHNRPIFGFGNSQKAKCLSTCIMKIPNQNQPMNLQVHVVDEGQAPVLLSVDTLRKLGAVIDFTKDQAVFSKVAPDVVVQLERSQTGHQLLPLSEDFCSQGRKLSREICSLESLVIQE